MSDTLDYRRLFESAPALYMVLAADPPRFTVLAASDAYLRAVKKTREGGFIGLPVFEALPPSPDDRSSEVNSRASFQRVVDLRVPDTMAVQRHDIVRPESEGGGYETRYWSPVNTPVLGDSGEVLYILHRVEDVTEFVQLKERGAVEHALAETLKSRAAQMEVEIYRRAQDIQEVNQRLREANDRLGELDRAKTAFFSNVSHEFRTPLTLMLGSLEELIARADAAAAPPLEIAHRNGLRLLKLVNALLQFSRVEAGRAQVRYEPTDVGTMTAALASSFASVCEQGGVHLVVNGAPTRAPVYVDRDAWEKIVLNLVSNAFKFTLSGEIEVSVRETDDACELVVRDTGVGIPEAELPRVFERFHRVATSTGRSLEGTGIGLSLVQELVKLHGGSVRVDSAPGRGTTFVVAVPLGNRHLAPEHVGPPPGSPPSPEGARPFVAEALGWTGSARRDAGLPAVTAVGAQTGGPAAADAQRARVLLVDDNVDLRDHIARLLAPRFAVEAVADGEDALAAARRDPPDLVLTDVMMPRLDGFGLLRVLRADPRLRTIPVVMLSARAGEEATAESLEAGADDYLVKPFSAGELVARVSANLRLARMREEVERAVGREEALKEVDRRKNEFLAMLSHELRNPLAPIRNSLYILDRAVPGGEQARRAQATIDRQAAHLTRMVEDLLDVSRITQGKMQVQKERLDLTALVRGAVEDAREMFDRGGVALEVQIPQEPLFVDGDPTRLAQIVGNLLGNAAKFTPRGGHASVVVKPEGARAAMIQVRDDGVGMSADVLAHLFQPFVQADRTLAHSSGGLGIGLAVVKGLVELHGGAVQARSDGPGTGTEMTVRLPLREPVKPALSVVARSGANPKGRRVLVIEDNADAARSLKEALELGGHEVTVAADGREGVAMAGALRPDAVVCDIGLPQMDGYAVARALRSDPGVRSVCLVAVTGYAALDDREKSRAAGFDHHLPKPPDVSKLEGILEGCGQDRMAGAS